MAMPQRDNAIRRRYLSYGGQIEGIKRLVLVLAMMVCGGALWVAAFCDACCRFIRQSLFGFLVAYDVGNVW